MALLRNCRLGRGRLPVPRRMECDKPQPLLTPAGRLWGSTRGSDLRVPLTKGDPCMSKSTRRSSGFKPNDNGQLPFEPIQKPDRGDAPEGNGTADAPVTDFNPAERVGPPE